MLRNKHGRQMASYEILPLFGLPPSSPIPRDFKDERVIDGVVVYIRPAGSYEIKRRVVAQCPVCDRIVCAGHFHQHFRVHGGNGR